MAEEMLIKQKCKIFENSQIKHFTKINAFYSYKLLWGTKF